MLYLLSRGKNLIPHLFILKDCIMDDAFHYVARKMYPNFAGYAVRKMYSVLIYP